MRHTARTGILRYSCSRCLPSNRQCQLLLIAVGFAWVCMIFVSRPALAEDLNLNFATANQSLWGPGSATVLGDSFNIVDINQDLHLPKFDGDPISGLLDFLGLGDVASVSLSPSAVGAAKLTASYQVNSGSIDVNYPQQVLLNLPGSIQAGQPFNVGLVYDTFENAGPIRFSSVNYADFLNSAAAGDGYSTTPVNKFMVPAPDVATEILPTPGF